MCILKLRFFFPYYLSCKTLQYNYINIYKAIFVEIRERACRMDVGWGKLNVQITQPERRG